MLKKLKALIITLLLFCLSFELFSLSFLYLNPQAELAPRLPSYHWNNVLVPKETKVISTEIGNWYQSDLNLKISFNRFAGCNPYHLITNSYGSRDAERALSSSSTRVIVLGDTMMEGMGVDVSYRISNLLESRSGIEHLNFSLKNTGSLHHLETYKALASEFDHDAIIVGLFPYDDFIDADMDKKTKFDASYSGQFLIGDYPNYEIVTHVPEIQKNDDFVYVEALLHEYTYSWHFLLYLRNRSKSKSFDSPSAYYFHAEDEFLKFSYPLEQLALLAPDKDIYLVSIPYLNDLKSYQNGTTAPFTQKMSDFADQYSNVMYFDLLQPISGHASDNPEELYFSCNKQHFSEQGYSLTADILYESLPIYASDRAEAELVSVTD
ncbi:MAG: hypothetical protein AAGD96_34685 [Chloroflexota bacterium]